MQKFSLKFDLTKYLIAAVLIIVPLYPKFPFIQVPGIYVAVRLEDFLLLFLAIYTLIKVFSDFRKFFSDRLIQAFILFFTAGLISLFAAIFLTQTAPLAVGALNFLRRVEYAIPLFGVLMLFTKSNIEDNLDYYIKILAIVVVVAFIYGVGQKYMNFPVIDTQNNENSKGIALFWTPGSHITSTFAGHYDLAAFMVLVLPIFSTAFFLTDKIKTKIFMILPTIFGLWLLGGSLSRVSLVSWVVASAIPLVVLKKYKEILLILFAAGAVVLLFPSLLGRYQRFIDVYAAETTPTSTPVAVATPTPIPVFEDRSTSIRLRVEWPRALRALSKNPLLGTGYSSITLATDNDYLRALGETGILGFLAFGLIFIFLGKEMVVYLRARTRFSILQNAFILGIMGAVVGTLITAFFIDIFEASKFATIFWFLVGYVVFLIRSKLYE